MESERYTVVSALTDIVAAPGVALDGIKEHVAWLWWPLLLNIGFALAVSVYYAYWVDMAWLIDDTIANLPADIDPAAAKTIRSYMSPAKSAIFATVGIVVITFLIYLIQSLWLHLVTKLSADKGLGFGAWFSFSAWTGFLGIFNTLIMLVVILLADNNQLPQSELSPLSMNALFIHAGPADPWFTWGSSLSLIHFWILGVMTLGVARWTGASMLKSAVIAWTPWVALFGIWALLIG